MAIFLSQVVDARLDSMSAYAKEVLLAVYGNPQEADEVASKLASALGCEIRGREAENTESPSRSAAVPAIATCGSGMAPLPRRSCGSRSRRRVEGLEGCVS